MKVLEVSEPCSFTRLAVMLRISSGGTFQYGLALRSHQQAIIGSWSGARHHYAHAVNDAVAVEQEDCADRMTTITIERAADGKPVSALQIYRDARISVLPLLGRRWLPCPQRRPAARDSVRLVRAHDVPDFAVVTAARANPALSKQIDPRAEEPVFSTDPPDYVLRELPSSLILP